MLALIVIFAFAVYLFISIGVVVLTVKWAKRSGRSAYRWGLIAVLFMYLLVFWDHIPTLMLHKYYCETKAGFWVYKTPEQWKVENPGVAETLTWQEISPYYKNPDGSFGFKLNDRFIDETRQKKALILPVTVSKDLIIDLKTGETMVERVRVGSGYGTFALGGNNWRVIKFWVKSESCLPGQLEFSRMSTAFKKIGAMRND